MHPPKHILDKLQELHPQVRIGWLGEDQPGCPADLSDDTDNRGCFVLLQLYHKRDFDRTFYQPFEYSTVFGKPYDPQVRQPVQLKAYQKQDVFNGAIIEDVRRMVQHTVRERYEASAMEKGSQVAAQISDLAGEAGQYLWHRKNKRDNADNVARKFTPEVEVARSADELKDSFMPTEVIGAGKMR